MALIFPSTSSGFCFFAVVSALDMLQTLDHQLAPVQPRESNTIRVLCVGCFLPPIPALVPQKPALKYRRRQMKPSDVSYRTFMPHFQRGTGT